MRYLDTASRKPEDTLARWLESFSPTEIHELRIQSGFFGIGGVGVLLPTLALHVEKNKRTTILLGSNDGATLRTDILTLAGYLGVPRSNASLGVVSFGNAFFHPKCYHLTREDGSQAAYVGSANWSAAGLALHIEAGICVDTREGDEAERLKQIASAIDAWFEENRDGFHPIACIADVEELVGREVLMLAPKKRARSDTAAKPPSENNRKAKLKPILSLPQLTADQETPADEPRYEASIPDQLPTTEEWADELEGEEDFAETSTSNKPTQPIVSAPKSGFPQYLLFDPSAAGPTRGRAALTGTSLPANSTGLIVQLNLDSARHFMGGKGTANISIPISTVGPIRFGIYGRHLRPRAEFPIKCRYISDQLIVQGEAAATSVQGYGYTATESGHSDIRLLVPAEVKSLSNEIMAAGMNAPTNGDFALLEWPTSQSAEFKLTFLDASSSLGRQAARDYATALTRNEIVGSGASWMKPGFAPPW